MSLTKIYQCFCDRTRLRVLHLLTKSSLCVCHFQQILGEPQVKVSKHLAYLRSRGLVSTAREKNWIIYSLPKRPPHELARNLKCLQDCVQTDVVFKRDLAKLAKLQKRCGEPRRHPLKVSSETATPAGLRRAASSHDLISRCCSASSRWVPTKILTSRRIIAIPSHPAAPLRR